MSDLEFLLGCAAVAMSIGVLLAAAFVVGLLLWRDERPGYDEPAEYVIHDCEWRYHPQRCVTIRRR